MPLSRRSVLRDAALLSLAGAAGQSTLKAIGQVCASPGPGSGQPFSSGIRVFFSGAWIFCSDNNGGILAVTTDMPGADSHKFPFGVWQKSGMDSNPGLAPKKVTGNYTIRVDQVTSAPSNIDLLFKATTVHPFLYLKNDKNDLSVNTSGDMVRAISLPRPTRILPAAFIINAVLSGDAQGRLQGWPGSPKTLATTYIFDYQGATQLTLMTGLGAQSAIDSVPTGSDYHFHTIPTAMNPGSAHAERMLGTLMGLLTSASGTLSPSDLTLSISGKLCLDAGRDTPSDLSLEELEMQALTSTLKSPEGTRRSNIRNQPMPRNSSVGPSIFDYHVGSCAGGGISVGGGG